MKRTLSILAALSFLACHANSAVLPAEKLLPDDTLVMFTIPDLAKSRDIYKASPQGRFWNDPSMQAFRDKFMGKLKSEYLIPLEHDLGIRFDDYAGLPQGQITFAMIPNGGQGKDGQIPGLLLFLDTKDKSPQLKSNLADLKKKWVDAGRTVKTETIRDIEFSAITLSSGDIPKSLKKAAGSGADATTEPADDADAKNAPKRQMYIGQAESLLIVGSSPKAIENVLARMSGAQAKSLSELAAYDACQTALFRDAAAFGWVNAKALVDMFAHGDDHADAADAGQLPKFPKIADALGLTGLKTIAFNYASSSEGAQFNLSVGVPEASRAGIFKILAGEPKEYNPPPFVPADAVKFQRWRIDGQKAWATLRKMVGDVFPQAVGYIDYTLGLVESAAKEKDPSFDIKKNLFGNLGDDLITYQKSSKGTTLADINSGPSLFLLSSPNPEQLAGALKGLLVLAGPQTTPTDREFLGHKIYSIPLPTLPGQAAGSSPSAKSLSYAFSGGYLAITADTSMLEEYLRSSQNQGKSLRETPGLADATQKVAGGGTYVFGYSNDSETMRVLFDVLAKDSTFGDSPTGPLAAALGSNFKIKDWVDVSLLPSFDKVSKYFYFSVFGGSVAPDGLNFKAFAPVPPQLKQ